MPEPIGKIRLALEAASLTLGPATLRQLAQHAQVGYDAARDTVGNMARRGVLRVVGKEDVDYRNRLVHVYRHREHCLYELALIRLYMCILGRAR